MRPSLLAIITSCLSHFGQSLAFRYRHQALVYQILDTFMASMLPIELTVHSQTSHPLDTILRSKLLCANSIGIPSCIASTRMRTKVSILTLTSIEVQRSDTKQCCYWFTLIVYCVQKLASTPYRLRWPRARNRTPNSTTTTTSTSTRRHTNTSSAAPSELRCC